ncbi:MAG: hypothetical protein B7X06_03280 [Verrucomicrobia bacterium 21-51-4]|nr:MAG: hypothetical protein B7X06_03280 [Verrucomicrobia bacterium 21-51-4]HQU09396.1 hypothetical protein [Opitutales bacterium]
MTKFLKAIIEPHQLETVESALADFGVDKETIELSSFDSDQGPRLCLEFKVGSAHVLDTLDAIARISRSSLGKIFVLDKPGLVLLGPSKAG